MEPQEEEHEPAAARDLPEFECCICLEKINTNEFMSDFRYVEVIPLVAVHSDESGPGAGHVFHRHCILTLVIQHSMVNTEDPGFPECPMCRQPFHTLIALNFQLVERIYQDLEDPRHYNTIRAFVAVDEREGLRRQWREGQRLQQLAYPASVAEEQPQYPLVGVQQIPNFELDPESDLADGHGVGEGGRGGTQPSTNVVVGTDAEEAPERRSDEEVGSQEDIPGRAVQQQAIATAVVTGETVRPHADIAVDLQRRRRDQCRLRRRRQEDAEIAQRRLAENQERRETRYQEDLQRRIQRWTEDQSRLTHRREEDEVLRHQRAEDDRELALRRATQDEELNTRRRVADDN